MSLSMYCQSIEISLQTGPDICDITPAVIGIIRESGIENGQVSAVMVGSTGSLTTIEYEPGVVEDLKRAINLLAPPGIDYAHEAAWHDGNGHSHVQAALLGPSIVLPIRNGNLKTGTWQQLVAVNHDNHPRTRTIEITIIGAKGQGQRAWGRGMRAEGKEAGKPGGWEAGKPGSYEARKLGGWEAMRPGSWEAMRLGGWEAGRLGSQEAGMLEGLTNGSGEEKLISS